MTKEGAIQNELYPVFLDCDLKFFVSAFVSNFDIRISDFITLAPSRPCRRFSEFDCLADVLESLLPTQKFNRTSTPRFAHSLTKV